MTRHKESSEAALSRRSVVLGLAGSGALWAAGCSRAETGKATAEGQASSAEAVSLVAAAAGRTMLVFRDPSCGCCENWVQVARSAGFQVELRDDADMPGIKRRLGVPEQLASCHTTEVDGLVVEGHVPLDDLERLLRERPSGVKGIAVSGMPVGSPGMEMPDGTRQPYQVIAFRADGSTSVFRG